MQTFIKINFTKTLLLSAMIALSACGKQTEVILPDDATDEVAAQETEVTAEDANIDVPEMVDPSADSSLETDSIKVMDSYSHLDPNHMVPSNLLKKAVAYYDANKSKIGNTRYLSVIDFSKKSTLARFFIINMSTGAVQAIHVAHGSGSDRNHDGYADTFSNVSGSNASSLGYYRAAETYSGKHGLSLKLDGLSSTNSHARARAVVIHGADYVREASVIQGRSWGCPAISMSLRTDVINRLKGGSIIYAGLSAKE